MDIPKLLIQYNEKDIEDLRAGIIRANEFLMSSFDLVNFKIETNIKYLAAPSAYRHILKCLFEYTDHDIDQTSVFESNVYEDYYEAHRVIILKYPEDESLLLTVDVSVYDKTRLRAFMLVENMIEMLYISYKTGKSLSQITLEDGGKWIFKM